MHVHGLTPLVCSDAFSLTEVFRRTSSLQTCAWIQVPIWGWNQNNQLISQKEGKVLEKVSWPYCTHKILLQPRSFVYDGSSFLLINWEETTGGRVTMTPGSCSAGFTLSLCPRRFWAQESSSSTSLFLVSVSLGWAHQPAVNGRLLRGPKKKNPRKTCNHY